MGKWAVIYSSVTGNTRTIAEAIAEQAGDADVFRVQDAPEDDRNAFNHGSEYSIYGRGSDGDRTLHRP